MDSSVPPWRSMTAREAALSAPASRSTRCRPMALASERAARSVRARNPAFAQIETAFLVEQALNVGREVRPCRRVELGVARVMRVEVGEHGQECVLVVDGGSEGDGEHGGVGL